MRGKDECFYRELLEICKRKGKTLEGLFVEVSSRRDRKSQDDRIQLRPSGQVCQLAWKQLYHLLNGVKVG